MDIKDLRYFVAAYEAKGFARAAVALNTVQSNVSARIRKLEAFLGETLFERHHDGVVATAKAELLYRAARRVLAKFDEIPEAVHHKDAA